MQDIFKEIEERQELQEQEAARYEAEEQAIKKTLNTKEGRTTLSWILSLCGVDASVTSSDALLTASLSGRRDVGLAIYSRLKSIDFALVAKMQKEDFDGRNRIHHTSSRDSSDR